MRGLAVATIVLLAACAPRPALMVPETSGGTVPPALRNAVAVGTVTGGEKTNPLGSAHVAADDVRQALVLALRARGMLADDAATAPYRLDVGILEVTEPSHPYATRLHAVLRYALRARDGSTRVDRVVDTVGEASVGETFVGMERRRVAQERAVRANLARAFDELAAVR
jgi:hypothetical protein